MTLLELVKKDNSFISYDRLAKYMSTNFEIDDPVFQNQPKEVIYQFLQEQFEKISPKIESFNQLKTIYNNNKENGNILINVNNNTLMQMLSSTDFDENIDITSLNFPFKNFYISFTFKEDSNTLLLLESFINIIDNKIEAYYFISFANSGKLYKPFNPISDEPAIINSIKTLQEQINKAKNTLTNNASAIRSTNILSSESVLKLLFSVLFYIATPKAQQIIEKEKENIILHGERIQRMPKKNYPYQLFNNIKYIYKGYEENKNNTAKRPHLVRGHFRNQPFGENLSKSKIIWIQPYFKGEDKEFEEKKYKI